MGDFVFNIAKGKVGELYDRVQTNDPANSALVVVLLAATGLETDAVLKDKDTLASVLAGTTNELTNTGYSRLTYDDSDLDPSSPDDINDAFVLNLSVDPNWASIINDGTGHIGKLLICYDANTTSGNDSNIVPLTAYDFPVVPDGTETIAQLSTIGFFRAR